MKNEGNKKIYKYWTRESTDLKILENEINVNLKIGWTLLNNNFGQYLDDNGKTIFYQKLIWEQEEKDFYFFSVEENDPYYKDSERNIVITEKKYDKKSNTIISNFWFKSKFGEKYKIGKIIRKKMFDFSQYNRSISTYNHNGDFIHLKIKDENGYSIDERKYDDKKRLDGIFINPYLIGNFKNGIIDKNYQWSVLHNKKTYSGLVISEYEIGKIFNGHDILLNFYELYRDGISIKDHEFIKKNLDKETGTIEFLIFNCSHYSVIDKVLCHISISVVKDDDIEFEKYVIDGGLVTLFENKNMRFLDKTKFDGVKFSLTIIGKYYLTKGIKFKEYNDKKLCFIYRLEGWYPTGEKKVIVVNNEENQYHFQNTEYIEFHKNGNTKKQIFTNKETQEHHEWYEDGILLFEGYRKFSVTKKHFINVSNKYYEEDGEIRSESIYNDGNTQDVIILQHKPYYEKQVVKGNIITYYDENNNIKWKYDRVKQTRVDD